MNYQQVVAGNQPTHNVGIQGNFDADNENAVYVSPSSSDKPKKHDEKAKRKAKGKSPVNCAPVRPNSINSTNSFNAAGPSDNVVSLNFEIGGKSSFVDPSQYPDDPYMPALEDIVYSDDEEDVGAEADFSNLETSIIVSPIPITRVHKDHHVTQIIIDLTSAPQTRKKPKRVHQALKDPSWIKAMQEELLQFKMQKGISNGCQSAFLYGTIEEKVYVCQPSGYEDPDYPDKVYKVVKALYGLHQAPRAWYETLANYLLEKVKQKDDGIFISQDKYVAKILRKFSFTDGKSASTPIDTKKPLLKDPDVKRIFSHYAGASLDRKSTTGYQFLGCRLIYWQCKEQTIIATSSTEAEYVAVASCCAQVLWIQNQLLNYGLIITAVSYTLMLFGLTKDAVYLMLLGHNFRVDAVEDFKEYTLRDYYCWYKLKLLDNAADSRLRLLEQSAVVDDKIKK
nr:hypothetical protein [Tanacetum cinerariifolium]